MSSVVFETATIADAVKKAARIAPSKGAAFDKASGLVFEIDSSGVILKATNLDVYYTEWLDYVSLDCEKPALLRLPSAMLAGVLSSLPIGSGKETKFSWDDSLSLMFLTTGRTKARLSLNTTAYYPDWYPFDPSLVSTVTGFGARLAQVEWAADSGTEPPFNGINLDGKGVIATDRYKLASVPLEIPHLDRPITIPAGILGPVLKDMGDTAIGLEGNQLLLMPDEHTQIRTVIYAVEYPKTDRIRKTDFSDLIIFRKDDLIAMIGRMMNLVRADRFPLLKLIVGNEELAGFMVDESVGDMEDAIELPGQAVHEPIEMFFNPKNLTEALSASPNDMVSLGYDVDKPNKLAYIDGGSGYQAWVAPRRGTDKTGP